MHDILLTNTNNIQRKVISTMFDAKKLRKKLLRGIEHLYKSRGYLKFTLIK